ncbi:response regulator [Leptolyngbya sp. FACHB-711]|uniref:response regulator n=1 Tax=unclassified Leptolyngbya TaxID=2650499 RepID=UPI0016891725|nr:response regulator [Leptolyngbya sp. FACHB-711]MBD1850783.1 response regulator [Cyanobacteria bacterium FACHB-502]MBD2023070.1 response regulator [Leptolyngbya sp. FACHB-711]
MQTIRMGTYRSPQTLHPLSLLAQMISRQASGCLQVVSNSTIWSLYLEQGKLVYASSSAEPFIRLDRHLRRLSLKVPSLVSAIRVQVRLLFESVRDRDEKVLPDYQAITWLIEQQFLLPEQAAELIEGLAREVLDSLLAVQTGSYELIEADQLPAQLPQFCQLDLKAIVESVQQQKPRSVPAENRFSEPSRSPEARPSEARQSEARQSEARQSEARPLESRQPEPRSEALTAAPLDRNGSSPFAQKIAPNGLPAPNYGAAQPRPNSAKTTYTIACIDDSPTVLQAINAFLDDKMFSVVLISDPVRALMQIIRSKPDLILLDVTMPSLDGYELCSLLRKHPTFRATPIIMVTGNTGFIDRAKARLVGASGYLTKPFTQSDLMKMVFKHLT